MSLQLSDVDQTLPIKTAEPPASPVKSALLIVVALFCGICIAGWLEGSEVESMNGFLAAESKTVFSDRHAQISQIHVSPGEFVTVGTPLVTLSDPKLEAKWAAKKSEVAALTAELEQANAKAELELTWRLKQLDAECVQTRLDSANYLKEKLTNEMENVAWREFVENISGSSPTTPDELFRPITFDAVQTPDEARVRAMLRLGAAQNAVEVNDIQVEICERRLAELNRIRNELPAKIRESVGVTVAEARLEVAESEFEQIDQQKSALLITSSSHGVVGPITKQVGETVTTGEPIVQLFQEDRRFVEIQVPTHLLSELVPDSELALRFPNGDKREGTVSGDIPHQTIDTTSDASASHTTPFVAMRIEPTGKLWPSLPLGSPVVVEFKQ